MAVVDHVQADVVQVGRGSVHSWQRGVDADRAVGPSAPNPSGGPQTADSGDLVGMYETLSGTPLDATVTALGDGMALKCVRADIFDLLADNTDLLQGIFSGLLRAKGD